MGKWISVEEKYPKHIDGDITKNYILRIRDGFNEHGHYITIGFYSYNEFEWFDVGGNLITDCVTHYHKVPKFKESNS